MIFILKRVREEALANLEYAFSFNEMVADLCPNTKRDLKKMNEIIKECRDKLLKEEDYDL